MIWGLCSAVTAMLCLPAQVTETTGVMRQGLTSSSTASTSGREAVHCLQLHTAYGKQARMRPASASGSNGTQHVHSSETHTSLDHGINPAVSRVQPSKTMALTDLAGDLKRQGKDVVGLTAGEPDFDTPAAVTEAGISALRSAPGTHHLAGSAGRQQVSSQHRSGWLQGGQDALHTQRRPVGAT